MAQLFFQRLGFFLALYLATGLAVFLAVEAIPGDPVALRFGKQLDPERVALERARLGLDDPFLDRFVGFQRSLLAGDWGESFSTGRRVTREFARYAPATAELSLSALLLGTAYGLGLSLWASWSRRRWVRRLAEGVAAVGLVVPIFWIGLLLLLVGGLWLGWFPIGGRLSLNSGNPGEWVVFTALFEGDLQRWVDGLRHLALPAVCLSVFPAAAVASVVSARLREPQLVGLRIALRARGYGASRIVWRHLLRIASGPCITVLGTSFGALLGGAFLTETVFSWPGLGRFLVEAILARDINVTLHVVTFLILVSIGVAFVSDFVARLLEPKERTSAP